MEIIFFSVAGPDSLYTDGIVIWDRGSFLFFSKVFYSLIILVRGQKGQRQASLFFFLQEFNRFLFTYRFPITTLFSK